MQGFFTSVETSEKRKPQKRQGGSIPFICPCGLNKGCSSPMMKPTGKGRRNILIVAEAPGKNEDEQGVQLIGEAGRLLRSNLSELGVDLDVDCRKTNVIRCRPPKNRKPTPREIAACTPALWEEIKAHPPKVIILLGTTALAGFLHGRWEKKIGKLERWRGWTIPDQKAGCWVVPTYHPAYLLRNEGNEPLERTFFADLKRAIKMIDVPFQKQPVEDVDILPDGVVYLKMILKKKWPIYIDYETTGLNPYDTGHKIVCVSMAHSTSRSVVFPLMQGTRTWELLQRVLADPEIKKLAHNIKHEDKWSRRLLVKPKAWAWDTMLAAHVLDNRRGICGLKFQTYIQFGVDDYSLGMEKWLTPKKSKTELHGANAKNALAEGLPKGEDGRRLLEYCGKDSLYGMRLAVKQQAEMKSRRGYKLLHDGILTLSAVEADGIGADEKYFDAKISATTKDINALESSLHEMEEWYLISDRYGKKAGLSKPQQIAWLLFNQQGHGVRRVTKTGKDSVDDDALQHIGTPFCLDLLRLRRLLKTRDTYLKGLRREIIDGRIHPSFSLHLVQTYRGSCSNPNAQNMPVRNKEQGTLVREGIVPWYSEDCIGEVDYSGIEVKVGHGYHLDPTMYDYLTDPTKDMHRDMGAQCYALKPEQVNKQIRYCGKNKFVFPEFYGSYWEQVAPDLWDAIKQMKLALDDGTPLRDHLASHGIKNFKRFEKHIRAVEDDFWHRRFKDYDQWKRDWFKEYLRKGYFKTLTGFTCRGPMRRNEVINYPVQGSAFHCLLWSLIRVRRWIAKSGLRTRVIGQIHDSVLFNFHTPEISHVLQGVRKIMCEDIREEWKWITVPLEIEAEIAKPGEPWSRKEKHAFN